MDARTVRHPAPLLIKLDVIGKLVTLPEREAEELRAAAGAEAGRSSARRDLSLLLDRGLRTRTTVALSRAEARELGAAVSGQTWRSCGRSAKPWRMFRRSSDARRERRAARGPLLLRGDPQSEVAVPGLVDL
jgi:hypothetical protein